MSIIHNAYLIDRWCATLTARYIGDGSHDEEF